MADLQHAGSRKLLDLISKVGTDGKLTYRSAAKSLFPADYKNYSRAVAQMCDLLDAAACVAGVPLLALVAVREQGGGVNSKAWSKEYGPGRSRIISRSLQHKFTAKDYAAIAQGLSDLKGLGNRSAWAFLNRTYGTLLYRRVVGETADPLHSALDDFGNDDPARALYASYTYLRDDKVRQSVLARAAGYCEYCGEKGFLKQDGDCYLETHHVIALASDGADRVTNVLALCANDHRKAHFSSERGQIEEDMLKKLLTLN